MLSRAEEMVEQEISAWQGGWCAIQNQFALEAGFRCCRRRLTTMIGLRRTDRDDRVRSSRESVADEELQLARLVATERKAGLIVAFDEQLRPAEFARQPWKFLYRRRKMREWKTRQLFKVHRRS